MEPDGRTKQSGEEEILLEWRAHLFSRERRWRSLVALVAVATSLVGGYVMVREPLAVAAYALILYFALGEFFFPVRYRLTDQGAYSRGCTGARFMAWERVKKCYKNEQGVKLSIFEYPSPLESCRGMFLRFGDKRDEVLPLVQRLVRRRSS